MESLFIGGWHMPLEAEVLGILIKGFLIVMIPALIMLVVLWIKNKKRSLALNRWNSI